MRDLVSGQPSARGHNQALTLILLVGICCAARLMFAQIAVSSYGLTIGASEDIVFERLGSPEQWEGIGSLRAYSYGDLIVIVKDGVVAGIETDQITCGELTLKRGDGRNVVAALQGFDVFKVEPRSDWFETARISVEVKYSETNNVDSIVILDLAAGCLSF